MISVDRLRSDPRRAIGDWIAEHGPLRALPVTRDTDLDIRLELWRRSLVYAALEKSEDAQEAVQAACATDFRAWRDTFAWAWDESRRAAIPQLAWQHVDKVQVAYLGLDGWRTPLDELHRVACHKARKVQVTVACATAALWEWGWDVEGAQGIQYIVGLRLNSVDDGKPIWGSSIFGKLRFMLQHQPKWLLPPSWQGSTRRWVDQHGRLITLCRGTAIIASTENVTALRGGRSVRVWIDEAQDIRHVDRVLEVTGKIAPEILTGTTSASWQGGKSSSWGRVVHGEIGELSKPGDPGGIVLLEVDYAESPDFDPATEKGRARIEAEKRTFGDEAFRREMGRDWGAGVAARIWAGSIPDGDKRSLIASAEELSALYRDISSARLVEGWDFGVQVSLTAWCLGAYFEASDVLYILQYCSWEHGLAEEVAGVVGAAGYRCNARPDGILPDVRVGDRAGGQELRGSYGGRRHRPMKSWLYNLAEEGIEVLPVRLDVELAIDVVRRKLQSGHIRLLPAVMQRHPTQPKRPSLIECIENYSRAIPEGSDPADYVGEQPKPRKDKYSHGADALQHVAAAIWL